MLPAVQDIRQELHPFFLANPERGIQQNFREADDRVERRAQLVRHIGEKLRLVAICGFDLPALVLDLAE